MVFKNRINNYLKNRDIEAIESEAMKLVNRNIQQSVLSGIVRSVENGRKTVYAKDV